MPPLIPPLPPPGLLQGPGIGEEGSIAGRETVPVLKYLAWLAKNFFQETMAWVRTEKKRTDRHVRRI
jgi:hypothetical protein